MASSHLAVVVQIDEVLDADEAVLTGEAGGLMDQARRLLLTPSEEGNGFEKHYFDALQRDPDVGLAHAEVSKMLRGR